MNSKTFIFILYFVYLFSCQNNDLNNNNSPDFKKSDSLEPSSNEELTIVDQEVKLVLPSEIIYFLEDSIEVLDTAEGDLNLDGIKDLIVVTHFKNEKEIDYDNSTRNLMVFIKNQDGTYVMKCSNKNIVLCLSCGGTIGDPYMGVVIKNGYFSIEHYGGSRERWTKTTTFKVEKNGNIFLHRDSEEVLDVMVENEKDEPKLISSISKTKKDFGLIKFVDYDSDKIKF